MEEIEEAVERLFTGEAKAGCQALRALEAESEKSGAVYPYFDRFLDIMRDVNSYKRTRGLILIAANAKWDQSGRIEEILPEYITHITDEKPITARQCIKALPKIAKEKPALREGMVKALHEADLSKYKESMWHLVYEDIVNALDEMERFTNT